MEIPKFTDKNEEFKYWESFDINVMEYLHALNKVKEEMYGKGGGNYSNLPGSCTQIVVDVANRIIDKTTQEFVNQ